MVIWQIFADTDDDFVFDDDDILSVKVQDIKIMAGIRGDFARVASVGTVTLQVNNVDGQFYLESGSPVDLRIGRWIQLKAVVDSIAYIVFTGVLDDLRRWNDVVVEISLKSRFGWLGQRVSVPLREDVLTSVMLAEVLEPQNCFLPHPLTDNATGYRYAVVNDPLAIVGSCYVYGSTHPLVSLETGKTALEFFGGVYDGDSTAAVLVSDIVAAEYGWLFEKRDGEINFYNRHHTIINNTEQVTFDDTVADFGYWYAANIVNRVRGRVIPRLKDTRVVWSNDVRIRVGPGKERLFRFRASDGKVLGISAVGPVFFSFSFEDDVGVSVTDVSVELVKIEDNGVRVRFLDNSLGGLRYVTVGSSITADALVQQEEIIVEALASPHLHGRSDLFVPGLEYTSVDFAEGLVNFVLAERRVERGYVDYVQLSDDSSLMFSLEILELVRVNSSSTGNNRQYRIMGYQYEWGAGSGFVRYFLRPANEENYAVVNDDTRNMIGQVWVAF